MTRCQFLMLFILLLLSVELQKVQNHLSLLRQEYVKLQNKYVELEQKYNLLVVESGGGEYEKGSFVSRLLNSVAELYDKELYRYLDSTGLSLYYYIKGFLKGFFLFHLVLLLILQNDE